MKIKYIDKPAGSGKTRFLISEVLEMARWGRKVLAVLPTKALIEQVYSDLIAGSGSKIRVVRIHEDALPEPPKGSSNKSPPKVISSTVAYFNGADQDGQVLLITRSTFEAVSNFHGAEYWDLIFDECPEAVAEYSIEVPEKHAILTDHLEISEDGYFVPLKVKNNGEVQKIVQNAAKDDVLAVFRDIAKQLTTPGWDCYVNNINYDNLKSGDSRADKFSVFVVRNTTVLSKFRSCTLISARFKETLFYKIMSTRGVDFVEYGERFNNVFRTDDELGFDFDEHENGELLEIHYLPIERWSKHIIQNYPELISSFIGYAIEQFAGKDFIFQSNKMVGGKGVDNSSLIKVGGIELGSVAHGLNGYRHIDNAFIYPAYNPHVEYKKFLNYLGLTDDDINIGIHCHGIYQALMRISLRDWKSISKKKIIVPDERAAFWLSNVFRGSALKSIPIELPKENLGKPGRPKQYKDARERKAAQRARDKALRLSSVPAEAFGLNENGLCHETLIREDNVTHIGPNSIKEWSMNIYPTTHITGGVGYTPGVTKVITFKSIEDVANLFNHTSRICKKEKKDGYLYNFTTFLDPIQNARNAKYATGACAIIFDNDGGDLTWKEFSELLCNTKMIISNTFSSTLAKPKWRVVIPLRRAVSVEEYGRLYEAILGEVRRCGYPLKGPSPSRPYDKVHGFDMRTSAITSIFYLPCQAKEEDGSFYEALVGDDRGVMNPDQWLQRVAPYVPSPPLAPSFTEGGDLAPDVAEAVKGAVAAFDRTGTLPGQGDAAIWALSTDLRKLGLPAEEARPILNDAARRTTSPDDRRKQVERIMKGWLKDGG
ncbi:DEAD/DEAH box helicase family protein [Xanthobacter oligotrophicus]|uniref:DEAD/DEAH box helicase family protein n=1 Tax=Xanthobacter oligotrophicus TaxID=2607286 RepID=UPI001EE5447F|nr:DEAD/DEAH box helicase family protein [Xanthobacter oligotrophicus]MCG5238126.1 hypothetical protein [Xanthobacter oligotrophicus]